MNWFLAFSYIILFNLGTYILGFSFLSQLLLSFLFGFFVPYLPGVIERNG